MVTKKTTKKATGKTAKKKPLRPRKWRTKQRPKSHGAQKQKAIALRLAEQPAKSFRLCNVWIL